MRGRFGSFIRRNAMTIITATVVVIVGGAAVAVAAAGPFTPSTSHPQAGATTGREATQASGSAHTANQNEIQSGNTQSRDDSQADEDSSELSGVVSSVDGANERITVTLRSGSVVTVNVSTQTTFSGGLQSITDLRAGMRVEVAGTKQTDGSFAARYVSRDDSTDSESSGD